MTNNSVSLHGAFVAERGERTIEVIARLTRQTVTEMAEHADIGLQAAHMWLEGLGNGYDLRWPK